MLIFIFLILNFILQKVDEVNNEEVEVDIDELLDMDSDEERRRHLQVNILFFALCILIGFHSPINPKTNLKLTTTDCLVNYNKIPNKT